MLSTTVALADVSNVEGFVAAARERAVRAYGLNLSNEEREELLAEGITALYELADAYMHHRPGYANGGRFSGYAAMMLPRRLADSWHGLHPEHHRVSENGERRWAYEAPPAPLEEASHESYMTHGAAEDPPEGLGDRLEAALAEIEPWQRLGVRRMCELARDGAGPSEIAAVLGVDRGRLAAMRERLGAALDRVGA